MSIREHRDRHDEVITELISAGYLSPRPRIAGFRTWSLLLPSIAQVIGLCCFGIVAWSFTEFSSLPSEYRKNLVVFGSFAIAIGGSVGSLPVTVECFRKGLRAWSDWAALIFSGVASFVETFVALSLLGGFEIVESLPRIGLLSFLATLDTCFGMAELGAYLESHDERMRQWRLEYRRAVKQYYSLPIKAAPPELPVPGGDFAYTPPMPINEVVTSNGLRPRCWCGVEVPEGKSPSHWYGRHKTLVHKREVKEFGDAVEAHSVLRDKYADTLNEGMWPFPTVLEIAKWRGGVVEN